ncbi:MAG TPA: hypothetical protein VNS50_04265 [Ginsengibacter sp.]|nr:hypothetical protein [Ginsengibacter sp.]
MIHIKYFLFYSFVSIGFISCAQSKYSIKNVVAVYKVHLPGNIAVDENGKEIDSRDTINFIYIETSTPGIQWEMAWKNGMNYSIVPILIDSNYFDAGTNKMTNENMILHAEAGSELWQLQLILLDVKNPPPSVVAPDEILLTGLYKGEKIIQKIKKQVELNSNPSQ